MADDDRIRRHGLQVHGGVDQCLALDHARGRGRDVDGIGGETLGSDFEAGSGARRGLEKEIDDGLAAQRRDLFDLSCIDVAKRLGGIENEVYLLGGQLFNSQKIFMIKWHEIGCAGNMAGILFRLDQQNLFGLVEFRQHHLDDLFICCRDVFADVISLNGQFSPAAVY